MLSLRYFGFGGFVLWIVCTCCAISAAPVERVAVPAVDPWQHEFSKRRNWWSFQPVKESALPRVKLTEWDRHPVDCFLAARFEQEGLTPAPRAEPHVLVRRLYFALIGLPPTPNEIESFLADDRPDRYEQLVDRLLGSPRFGERWARHWMDLVRYADSHGSEGDPEIPMAWRYRDYLIRAFNSDVPLDQLIREQIAGDLLPAPRWDTSEGVNESVLGISQFRFVEHGFQPIDTLEEQVKYVDNQIDVLTKAFQGLTVSCARCHDHKFDPISQRDYYAVYGILASTRPAQVTIDSPDRLRKHRAKLEALKRQVKSGLIEAWLDAAEDFSESLLRSSSGLPADADLDKAADDERHPLHIWARLRSLSSTELKSAWNKLQARRREEIQKRESIHSAEFRPGWDLARSDESSWFMHGANPPEYIPAAGEFTVEPSGDLVVMSLWPSGVFTHRLSQKHNGILMSPRFEIESDSIFVRALGGKGARVRVVVDHYPLGSGNIFPQSEIKSDVPHWIRLDTAYRKGSSAYIEFVTADDVLSRDRRGAGPDGRSYFGVQEILFGDGKQPPPEFDIPSWHVLDGEAPDSTEALAERYGQRIAEAVDAWGKDRLSDSQRTFLDGLVRAKLLPVSLTALPRVGDAVEQYRTLEEAVPIPRRAAGVVETVAHDAPLLQRGDHKLPEELVPRGYLQVFGGPRFETTLSGRLELANAITDPQNPLTARVLVNRIWHHLFGRGLVATVDNFGLLGDRPTHPELLDFLAARFVKDGWSMKRMIRLLVTSRAYRSASEPSPRALEIDPDNELLSHMLLRRLEAEAIRDNLLAVSGRLDNKMFGVGDDPFAPPAQQRRRSVYLKIRRNSLPPFLEIFDAPKPFTTLGRRDQTNVPAQSLALLNDRFVSECADHWARFVVAESSDLDARIRGMFERAFARSPTELERAVARAYIAALADAHQDERTVWRDFAQSLFNMKEFIYVR